MFILSCSFTYVAQIDIKMLIISYAPTEKSNTVYCGRYNSHTAPLFFKLKLLTVKDILALQELTVYYKFTHNELPSYFQNWHIVRNSEIYTHNTRRQHYIHIVGIKHTVAKQCRPIRINNSPQIVKNKLSTHNFRGFINYAKFNFSQSYHHYCTVVNCYMCYS